MKTSMLVFIGMLPVFLAENCRCDETTWNAWQKGRLEAQWRKRCSSVALPFSACPYTTSCMVLWQPLSFTLNFRHLCVIGWEWRTSWISVCSKSVNPSSGTG